MADLFLGFDLSTQSLKAIAVDGELNIVFNEEIIFGVDTKSYGTNKGVIINNQEQEVISPVVLWLDGLDILLEKIKNLHGENIFSRVKIISGAAQQHGSVYWSNEGKKLLNKLCLKNSSESTLSEILIPNAFSYEFSPNWQDHSTGLEIKEFENTVGGGENLAKISGSKAHYRFTGPQIMRFRKKNPQRYNETLKISLISSFITSIFLGDFAPLDCSDVCGMNLWDILNNKFYDPLLNLTAGGSDGVNELKNKLGNVSQSGNKILGNIALYFVEKYKFSKNTKIIPFTGDNPSTILSVLLRPTDAMVSLGTSTTLLVSTSHYVTSTEYHMFVHPTTPNLYMGMLCYCNGGLAREQIRDELNKKLNYNNHNDYNQWNIFDKDALSTPPLNASDQKQLSDAIIGFYFPLREIVPDKKPQRTKFLANLSQSNNQISLLSKSDTTAQDARCILESQALSMRMRAHSLLKSNNGHPKRLYIVGGGSANHAIAQIYASVLGPTDGVYKLSKEAGSNACALGGAYKAAWAGLYSENSGVTFEEMMSKKWHPEGILQRIDDGVDAWWSLSKEDQMGLWEKYGRVLPAFSTAETLLE